MLDMEELLRDLPVDTQNRIYEEMATLDEAGQERYSERIVQAMAQMPVHDGGDMERLRAARDAREAHAPLVGEPAPDFDLRVLDGDGRVRLADLHGKPVGLIFGSYT